MSDGGVYKETGRSTLDEIRRIRRRLQALERTGALASANNSIRADTSLGPVGVSDQFLRLDATNDPVTGALSLADALTVAGATALGSTLAVTGLSTFSEMVDISAPTVGVACLRLHGGGAGYTTLSPDSPSLTGHRLWFDAADITASDGTECVIWTSKGGLFSSDNFTKDTVGPVYKTSGAGSTSKPYVYTDGSSGYLDTGTAHNFGGAGVGLTLFLVYRAGDTTDAAAERIVGRNSGVSVREGFRPPGKAASANFNVRDPGAAGAIVTVSDSPVSAPPAALSWNIAVFRKDTSNQWYCTLNGTDQSNAIVSAVAEQEISGILVDNDQIGFVNSGVAEIVAYQADIGATAATKVHDYLAEKYGLSYQGAGTYGDYARMVDSGGNIVARFVDGVNPQFSFGKATPSVTLDVQGDAAISGQLTAGSLLVSGLCTLSDTDAQALTAASLAVSGLSTLSATKVDALYLDDNRPIYLGTSQDCSVLYDASNLVINPKLAGAGRIEFTDGGANTIRFGLDSGKYMDGQSNASLNIQRLSSGDLYLVRGGGAVVVNGNTNIRNSTLRVNGTTEENGGHLSAIRTVTTSDTMTADDQYLLVVGATSLCTITLPATTLGGVYTIKNCGTYPVVVVSPGAATIDGETSQTISDQWNAMKVINDDTDWFIV